MTKLRWVEQRYGICDAESPVGRFSITRSLHIAEGPGFTDVEFFLLSHERVASVEFRTLRAAKLGATRILRALERTV